MIRLQAWELFEKVQDWNTQTCKKYGSNAQLATCHTLHGWKNICQGLTNKAIASLNIAEKILRPTGMVEFVCRLDWVLALWAEAQRDHQTGLRHVQEALPVCADKGFLLRQADLLVIRGRLYTLQFKNEGKTDRELVEKAGDDGRIALKIAEDTGYVWAKLDALKLLGSYHELRAELDKSKKQQEIESAQQYAKEADDLEKSLMLTEEEMKELEEQAKATFEEQTSDWEDNPDSF